MHLALKSLCCPSIHSFMPPGWLRVKMFFMVKRLLDLGCFGRILSSFPEDYYDGNYYYDNYDCRGGFVVRRNWRRRFRGSSSQRRKHCCRMSRYRPRHLKQQEKNIRYCQFCNSKPEPPLRRSKRKHRRQLSPHKPNLQQPQEKNIRYPQWCNSKSENPFERSKHRFGCQKSRCRQCR